MPKKLSHVTSKRQSHIAVRKTPFVPAAPNTGGEQVDANPPSSVAQAMAQPMRIPAPTVGDAPVPIAHFGRTKVTKAENYRLAKGEEISPAYDVTSRQESPAEHDKRVGNQRQTFNDNYTPNQTVKSTGSRFLKKGETVIAAADSE